MNILNYKKTPIFYPILVTLVVFFVTVLLLSVLGLAPKSLTLSDKKPKILNSNEIIDINSNQYTRPDQIIIEKIGVNSVVNKPDNPDIKILDESLLSGAVHYPGSGSLERGNIFIFGHSTNWQIVRNQAFKTFNNLDKLQKGDEIIIVAGNKNYIYGVQSVKLVDEDYALVEFDSSKKMLTLSTCNTFGQKQERWVVEADFISIE